MKIDRIPLCPICGDAVNPNEWRAPYGIVICIDCNTRPPRARLAALHAIRDNPNHRLLSIRHGLTFYTPLGPVPPDRPEPLHRDVPYLEHPHEIAANRDRAKTR